MKKLVLILSTLLLTSSAFAGSCPMMAKGVDAKIHYPTSMHLQPAAKVYGYKKGDFPISEKLSDTSISLPVHEFITKKN